MDELAKAVLEEVGGAEVAEEEDTSAIDDNALVKVVNNIIRESVLNDISDIHIEPRPTKVVVRVRKDGSLREYMTMPKATASAMAARIKIMGGLNIAERRVPQDGRVRFKDKNMEVDLRLSTPADRLRRKVRHANPEEGQQPSPRSRGWALPNTTSSCSRT